jgi:hypothetical protein
MSLQLEPANRVLVPGMGTGRLNHPDLICVKFVILGTLGHRVKRRYNFVEWFGSIARSYKFYGANPISSAFYRDSPSPAIRIIVTAHRNKIMGERNASSIPVSIGTLLHSLDLPHLTTIQCNNDL